MRSIVVGSFLGLALVSSCDDDDDDAEQCPDHDHDRVGELQGRPHPQAHDHDDPCAEEGEFGPPTESVCPPNSTLTWESFGQSFMSTYCTRCHASTLEGDARMGAPLYHDFDSLMGVLVVADHVDEKAAAGPAATNTFMPIGTPTPTMAERQQLGEWLQCELDKM